MDAREVIRHFLQCTDLSCDDLITALEWHGNRILHDSQNHGPTVERAVLIAKEAASECDGAEGWLTGEEIAAAIRQLKEDRG